MHPIHLVLLLAPLALCQILPDLLPKEGSKPDPLVMFGIPRDLWRCGPNDFIANMVMLRLNETCPLAAAEFNHCCAVHDDCYDNQRGQTECDAQLCDCMAFYVANDKEAKKCDLLTKIACNLVSDNGEEFYNASVKDPSAPAKEEYLRLPEELPMLKEEYQKMNEKCATQHATLSSCALNFDLCYRAASPTSRDKPQEGCLVNLLRCLDATKPDRDSNPECDVAIEHVLYKMVEKAEEYHEEGEGGDLNVLMMQENVLNKTYIQRVYLQVVRQASSYSWIVYFSFCLTILICCIFSIIGIAQCTKEDHYRDNETINFHVSTHSATSPASKSTTATSSRSQTSESERPSSKK